MKAIGTTLAKFALLAILFLTGCSSATETTETSETTETTAETEERSYDKLLTKEELAASAKELQDKLVEIVKAVSDSASAEKAVEECKKLQPLADQITKSGEALIKELGNELAPYLHEHGPSDKGLAPIIPVLGETKEDSKYPELHQTVVEILEGSVHVIM